ncbi:MAG: hypothetical protein KDH88_10810 [Chromatiales bacterium]|nr:hypothetical protein [Chromatiales bacterium]
MPSAAIATIFLILGLFSAQAAAGPELRSSDPLPTAGYFTLSWSASESTSGEIQVQQSVSEDFSSATTLYQGHDTASVLSGLSDGLYYYRAREIHHGASPGDWGETLSVEVAHHPLNRALAFFGLGAVVFLATLILVLTATRSTDRD